MYKAMYICDYCGKDMENSPEFTVMFKSNGLAVYEPKEWHYCRHCWTQIEHFLSEGGVIYRDSLNHKQTTAPYSSLR